MELHLVLLEHEITLWTLPDNKKSRYSKNKNNNFLVISESPPEIENELKEPVDLKSMQHRDL